MEINRLKKSSILIIVLIFHAILVSGKSDTILFDASKGSMVIGKQLRYHNSEAGVLDPEKILKQTFVASNEAIPNLGISNASHWFKFKVKNKTNDDYIYLEFRQPLIDYIAVYEINKPKNIRLIGTGGDLYPFHERELIHPNYFFSLPVRPNETKEFLVGVKSGEQILGHFMLADQKSAMSYIGLTDTLFGLYAGIILALLLYNLFIFFTVREMVYIKYVVYILFIGLTQLSLQGYSFKFLAPGNSELANLLPYLFSCFVGLSAIYFMRDFLESKNRVPNLHKASYFFEYAYWGTILIPLLGFFNFGYLMVLALAGSISFYMLYTGFVVYMKGYRPAKYFLIGWSMLLIGIIIYVLKDFNVLPTNFVTAYTMPIGSAVEVILLSFALADRINILKKEKDASQKAALQSSNEKAQIIEEQKAKLKKTVDKKTKDLRIAIKHLKATQSTLVEAEKMASLGQLTAGIAHEINNPINFISSNISPLKNNFQDLIEIINCYDKIGKGENAEVILNKIDALKNDLDYDYLITEIEEIFGSLKYGTSRVIDIVNSLRTFSSLDESEIKRINLNLALKSTITLIRSNINSNIDIIEDYDEDLPLIECYPSFLNQALMNIINNAVQAIEEKDVPGEDERITVRTKIVNLDAHISISDTGIGIPKRIQSKIFDPFYTTRPVGKGTGLGLSVAFKTVKRHNGTIEVISSPGAGTSFIIKIPITMNASK